MEKLVINLINIVQLQDWVI